MDDISDKFAPLTDSELSAAQVIVAPDAANATPIMPIPKTAGRCSIRFEGREADERYWFKDAQRRGAFRRITMAHPGRDKRVRPCVYTTKGGASRPHPRRAHSSIWTSWPRGRMRQFFCSKDRARHRRRRHAFPTRSRRPLLAALAHPDRSIFRPCGVAR